MSGEHHRSLAEPRTQENWLQNRVGRGPQNSGPDIPAPPFLLLFGCVGRRRGRKRKLQQQEPSLLAVNTVPPPKHRQAEGGEGRLGILWFGIWFPGTMRAQLRGLRWAE